MVLLLQFLQYASLYVASTHSLPAKNTYNAHNDVTLSKRGGTWHAKSDRHHEWLLPSVVSCPAEHEPITIQYDALEGMFRGAVERPNDSDFKCGKDYECYWNTFWPYPNNPYAPSFTVEFKVEDDVTDVGQRITFQKMTINRLEIDFRHGDPRDPRQARPRDPPQGPGMGPPATLKPKPYPCEESSGWWKVTTGKRNHEDNKKPIGPVK